MPIEKISANSDTRLIVKPIAQDANRVSASVMTTALPTTIASRQPSASSTSSTTESVAKISLWISLVGLVGRGAAVVARDLDVHAGRNRRRLRARDPRAYGVGDVGRVGAGLLRDRDRHRRRVAVRGTRSCRRRAEPDVARGQIRRRADPRDIGQEHRLAVLQADDELRDLVGIGEERACGDRAIRVAADAIAGLGDDIGALQRAGEVVDRETVRREPRRIEFDHDRAVGRADRIDVARAGNALELGFERMRDFGEFGRAARGSSVHSVSAITGTSSMPIGRTSGWPTPRPAGTKSWFWIHLVVEPHDRRLRAARRPRTRP